MPFDYFWKLRRKAHPKEAKYLSLCHILGGSGEAKKEIDKIFTAYMTLKDYDKEERKEMVAYLFKISKL